MILLAKWHIFRQNGGRRGHSANSLNQFSSQEDFVRCHNQFKRPADDSVLGGNVQIPCLNPATYPDPVKDEGHITYVKRCLKKHIQGIFPGVIDAYISQHYKPKKTRAATS